MRRGSTRRAGRSFVARHSKKGTYLLAFAILLLTAPRAWAEDVFFNGVKIHGVRNQTFKNCTVSFDKQGNLHIKAPGYKITTREQHKISSPDRADSVKLKHRYFLVGTGKQPSKAQYDVDVYVNGKWIRKIRASEPQVVEEITDHLRSGKNQIQFAATKNYRGGGRVSSAAQHFLRVLVGIGTQGGGTLNITKTLADFRATAEKTGNFSSETLVTVE